MPSGSVVFVGTGINTVMHLTPEARAWIEAADEVFYLVGDPLADQIILKLRPEAISLLPFYSPDKERRITYQEISGRIMQSVRAGRKVCVAFYGHPAVFVDPTHNTVRQARKEGFSAAILPGVSAEDCLFADLSVDPGQTGCQSFEATDFLVYRRKFDIHSTLILWQSNIVGESGYHTDGFNARNLKVLAEVLTEHYGPDHDALIYEAAVLPMCKPVIKHVTISNLVEAGVSAGSTLYIPPKGHAPLDLDMLDRLGIPRP